MVRSHSRERFNMSKYQITEIQLFDYAYHRQTTEDGDFEVIYSYSANLIINDEFVVQVSSDLNEATFHGVASSDDVYWNNEKNQDNAFESIDNDELKQALSESGFENNIAWLEENTSNVINPENAKYRYDNANTQ